MNKELIFKLLNLDVIKIAMEKYRIDITDFTYSDGTKLDTITFRPKDENQYGFSITFSDKNGVYVIKSFYNEHTCYVNDIAITQSEFNKCILSLLIIKDYLKSYSDNNIANLINEIINE